MFQKFPQVGERYVFLHSRMSWNPTDKYEENHTWENHYEFAETKDKKENPENSQTKRYIRDRNSDMNSGQLFVITNKPEDSEMTVF